MWEKLKGYGLLFLIFLLSVLALILSMPRRLSGDLKSAKKKVKEGRTQADEALENYESVKDRHDQEIGEAEQIDYPDEPKPFTDAGSAAGFLDDLISDLLRNSDIRRNKYK